MESRKIEMEKFTAVTNLSPVIQMAQQKKANDEKKEEVNMTAEVIKADA